MCSPISANPVLKGKLGDNTAVCQGFQIQKRKFAQPLEVKQAGDLQDSQVFLFFQSCQCLGGKLGRGHDLKVQAADKLRAFQVKRPVDNNCAPKGGNTVGVKGLTQDRQQRILLPGRSARIIVLENHCRRFGCQVLQDIDAVINIGQVDFARVFARLQHVFFV